MSATKYLRTLCEVMTPLKAARTKCRQFRVLAAREDASGRFSTARMRAFPLQLHVRARVSSKVTSALL